MNLPPSIPPAKRAGRTQAHTALVDRTIWLLSSIPRCDFAVNTVLHTKINGRYVRAGIVGQADITGVVGPEGWRVEIECKTGTGRLTDWQNAWREKMLRCGAIWLLCRDEKVTHRELIAEIQRRRKEVQP